jgi:hypothetical protein
VPEKEWRSYWARQARPISRIFCGRRRRCIPKTRRLRPAPEHRQHRCSGVAALVADIIALLSWGFPRPNGGARGGRRYGQLWFKFAPDGGGSVALTRKVLGVFPLRADARHEHPVRSPGGRTGPVRPHRSSGVAWAALDAGASPVQMKDANNPTRCPLGEAPAQSARAPSNGFQSDRRRPQ